MGNLKDFATSKVVTAPSPATSGTSLSITSSHGTRFPATPFSAVAHPSTEMPTLDNAEKVTVTNITGDTFTITRAQGGTTAKAIATDWIISNTLFLDDIPTRDSLGLNTDDTVTFANLSGTNTGDQDLSSYATKTGVETLTNKVVTNVATSAPATPSNGMLWWDTDDVSNVSGDLTTDNIYEETAGNGVSVDGVVHKDGLIVGGSGTGVSNSSLSTTAGDIGGAWNSFTTTPTAFTISSQACYAAKIGKVVHVRASITVSAVSGSISMTMPYTANTTNVNYNAIGVCRLMDVSTGKYYQGVIEANGTNSVVVKAFQVDGTGILGAATSSSIPHTWASGDILRLSYTYEAE